MDKNKEFYIFTPGPVKMPDYVLEEGRRQLPYFRTDDFSRLALESQEMILELVKAGPDFKVIYMAASGTGVMEAVVLNLLSKTETALVINGGTFGQRFVDLCRVLSVPCFEHKLPYGEPLETAAIAAGGARSATMLINGHETSTGVLFDIARTGEYCSKNGLMHVVDAISMFLTDEIDMLKMNIDALILSSQKGLALAPGLGLLVLSPRAQEKIRESAARLGSLYFRLADYLNDMARGQNPYTPPLSVMFQMYARLKHIRAHGGAAAEIRRAQRVAAYFRAHIQGLPLAVFSKSPPNAMTSLSPTDGRLAHRIVKDIEDRYNIFVCPNGGELRDKVFRVSHMGDIDEAYTDVLIRALQDYYSR
jgi:aspartate aminotransferase-like enzyme